MIDANKDKRNEINEKLRKEIVDIADIWDGPESEHYGKALLAILYDLGIQDVPEFYKKENIDKMIKKLVENRFRKDNVCFGCGYWHPNQDCETAKLERDLDVDRKV